MEGEVVCASCARSLQLRELDEQEEFRAPTGTLLRAHDALGRAERRLDRIARWARALAVLAVGIAMSLGGAWWILEARFAWGALVVALLGAIEIYVAMSLVIELRRDR